MENIIGSKLKTARKNKRLTLSEVANKVNCSPAYICRIEGGSRQNINYKLYAELVKLYGIEDELKEEGNSELEQLMTEILKQNKKIAEVQWTLVNLNEDLSELKSYSREVIDLFHLSNVK